MRRYLFPYIAPMDRAVPDDSMLVPMFGTLEYPLRSTRHDHGEDAAFLDAIRQASNRFTLPDDACARHRMLYSMLAEFTRELEAHIQLENDILFPRDRDGAEGAGLDGAPAARRLVRRPPGRRQSD